MDDCRRACSGRCPHPPGTLRSPGPLAESRRASHAARARPLALPLRCDRLGYGLIDGQRVGDVEGKLVVFHVDRDAVAVGELLRQRLAGEWVLDLALDQAAQGTGAVGLVVAVLEQPVLGYVGQLDRDVL